MKVYLDNSATTKPYEEVIESMGRIQKEHWGNPSSAHSMGLDAEKVIKRASDTVAGTINTNRNNIIFTSCGTESNNMALMQPFHNPDKIKRSHVIISSIEHPSVNGFCEQLESFGAEVTRIPVDGKGLIDIDALKFSIKENTAIISIMYVNNEIGTIQPITQISAIKEEALKMNANNLLFHCDGVQAYCKIPIDLSSQDFSGIDMMAISAHKIHGPKGIGVLYARNTAKINPFLTGGGQQRSLRSGTENVAGIEGFGCSSEISHENMTEDMNHNMDLRQRLLKGLMDEIPDIKINSPMETSKNGEAGKCVPHILSVSFAGTKGEAILHSLEQWGIFVSTQSACSSKKKAISPVLKAIGLTSAEAEGTIRFSLSRFNTEDDIDYTVDRTKQAVAKMRKLTRFK